MKECPYCKTKIEDYAEMCTFHLEMMLRNKGLYHG